MLGKFEVLLRADCLSMDLPLLLPYLAKKVSDSKLADMAGCEPFFSTSLVSFLVWGGGGG